MSNLLSPETKRNIKRGYLFRLLVLIFLIITILFALASILLLPSYLGSKDWKQIQTNRLVTLKDISKILRDYDAGEVMRSTNIKMGLVLNDNKENKPKLNEIISLILSKKINDISITGIVFESNDENTPFILVSGIAKDRETLRHFSDLLKEETVFTRVDLPVSTLAPDKDISFSLKIEGEF